MHFDTVTLLVRIVLQSICCYFLIFRFFVPAPSAPLSFTHTVLNPDMFNGPRIKLTWQKPAEPNGDIRSYTVSFSHSENTQEEITGLNVSSYTIKVLGGVQYQFSVRAVTIKPGPDASSIVKVPEYSEFSFHFKHILKIYFVFENMHLVLQMQEIARGCEHLFCVKNGNCMLPFKWNLVNSPCLWRLVFIIA